VAISVNIFHAIIWPKSQLVTEFLLPHFLFYWRKKTNQNKTKQKRSNKHAPNNVHLQEITSVKSKIAKGKKIHIAPYEAVSFFRVLIILKHKIKKRDRRSWVRKWRFIYRQLVIMVFYK